MISILNKWGEVLYSSEADSIRGAVEEAVKKGANLSGVDLSGVDLFGANLSGADLTRAYLTGADLTGADLTEANLTGANLTGADLTGAVIPAWSLVIPASRHVITACPDQVRIGCHARDIDSWLRIYEEVGRREGYTDSQIEEYGQHLRLIKQFTDSRKGVAA